MAAKPALAGHQDDLFGPVFGPLDQVGQFENGYGPQLVRGFLDGAVGGERPVLDVAEPTLPAERFKVLPGILQVEGKQVVRVIPANPRTPPQMSVRAVLTRVTARYGVPPVGTKVFVRVNQYVDGWEDLPLTFAAIVPTAA
jgi:hypothetical protein